MRDEKNKNIDNLKPIWSREPDKRATDEIPAVELIDKRPDAALLQEMIDIENARIRASKGNQN